MDTLRVSIAQNDFANLYFRLGYDLTDKLMLSFDIDLIGLTFGSEQTETNFFEGENSLNDGIAALNNPVSSPTSLNYLVIGDYDSLNSTLTMSYALSNKIGIDAGFGLVFTEYTTDVAMGYDGNDRFRNKNGKGYIGIQLTLAQ